MAKNDDEPCLVILGGVTDVLSHLFSIGAAFARQDVDKSASTLADQNSLCVKSVYWVNFYNGGMTWAMMQASDSFTAVSSGSDRRSIGNSRCRILVGKIKLKTLQAGIWADRPLPNPPPYVARPPSSLTITRQAARSSYNSPRKPPEEIGYPLLFVVSDTPRGLPEETAKQCPRMSGVAILDTGLHFNLSWHNETSVTPGIRRNEDARSTTLIFQTQSCRLEIDVMREILVDQDWQPSALSPFPEPASP